MRKLLKACYLSIKRDFISLSRDRLLLFFIFSILLLGFASRLALNPRASLWFEGKVKPEVKLYLQVFYGFDIATSPSGADIVITFHDDNVVHLEPRSFNGYLLLERVKLGLLSSVYATSKIEPPLSFCISLRTLTGALYRFKGLWLIVASLLPMQFIAIQVFEDRRQRLLEVYSLARRRYIYLISKLVVGTGFGTAVSIFMAYILGTVNPVLTVNLSLSSYTFSLTGILCGLISRRLIEVSIVSRVLSLIILLSPLFNLKLDLWIFKPELLFEFNTTWQLTLIGGCLTLCLVFIKKVDLEDISGNREV